MSSDQELAATGGSSVIGGLIAAIALIGAGVLLHWRKFAQRSASRTTD